ncbi:MAG: DUF4031 domain-containing protein [Candidatus Nanoarchaeia archaeon]|nr:DUF4031 domain-containing protein [Candidatus Nanoarchaeia archaeon]
MIYTDGVHLISNHSREELHEFAKKMGLKRSWFQNHKIPHYDLLKNRSQLAIKFGAIVVTTRELIKIFRNK